MQLPVGGIRHVRLVRSHWSAHSCSWPREFADEAL